MAKPKTDYAMLRKLGPYIEKWCDSNAFKWTHPSRFQWNIYVSQIGVIIAIYPGSGMMYLPYAHYTGLGIIDKSGQKLYFTNEKELEDTLSKVLFAADGI